MIDTLVHSREKAAEQTIMNDLKLASRSYVLMTMHRPSNVDTEPQLEKVLETIEALAAKIPVVLPLHPRTRNRLESFSMMERLEAVSGLCTTEPLGYLEFLQLMDNDRANVTETGGIKEETPILQVH